MGRVKQPALRHDLVAANGTRETGVSRENNRVDSEMADQLEHGSDIDAAHESDPDMDVEDAWSDVGDDDMDANEAASDADSFDYNDDDVDADFELDADVDSEYEDGPAKRRRNTTTATPKKGSSGKSNLQTPKKARATPKKAKPTPVKPRRASEQPSGAKIVRALKKAQRDIERRRSRGQPRARGDRALRCLPYITKNRAPKRQLIRWNEETYCHTLLALAWALEIKGIEIPWEETAALVQPGATGEAFKQALGKLRAKRVKEGLPVPPMRPGKDMSRQECVDELARLLRESREAREAKNAGESSTSSESDDGEEQKRPTFFEDDEESEYDEDPMDLDLSDDQSGVAVVVDDCYSPEKRNERCESWVDDVATNSLLEVSLQTVTGLDKDSGPRPSSAVKDHQARTGGLGTDMEAPAVGSGVTDVLAIHPTPTRPRNRPSTHGRSGSQLAQAQQQEAPSTPPSQTKASLLQGHVPVTPPPRLRTPEECPPAPRSRSNSDLRGRQFSHLRKRSSEDVGLPPSTPVSKRRQPDTVRKSTSRRPSLSQIPESGPAGSTPTQQPANMPGQAFGGPQGQPFIVVPGGAMVAMPLQMQLQLAQVYGYGDMQQMGNPPMQPMPPAVMPNMVNPFSLMNHMQQGLINNLHPMAGQQAPGQQMLPAWQTNPSQQAQPGTQNTEIKHESAESQSSVPQVNTGISMQNFSARDFAAGTPELSPERRITPERHVSSERHASPGRNAGPGSVSSGVTDSLWNLTTGGDFVSPRSASFPTRDIGSRAPFQGLGRLSEEPDAEQTGILGSQDTATDSFDRSTQDSFGSNVQGSRVTPAQPRSVGEDGALKDSQD
ncbi:putative rna-binding protein cabeza-like protein [Diplodia seriata]|uniref:Putative rna-binding protein cabeza-like protein n=1 Tax=Diplodia seriata TaxID=420778 RepID=A0A0G2E8E2_9PEZI|nr:putative rna-binding protein cabeza-like protein [Diplodia seriata]